MAKRSFTNLQLVLVVLLLCVGMAEVGLRVIYRGKFGKRPGFFVGDQQLGWRPAANLDHTFFGTDFTMHVRTDAEGYRLGALGAVDLAKELIVVAGDSYVFGWSVHTEETFASFLDERVADESRGRARTLNLGVGGYGTLQSGVRLGRFLNAHSDSDVRAVVVFHSPNDPVDNVNSIGYHIGVWEVIDRQPKARSRVHLVNFADYVLAVFDYKRDKSKYDSKDDQIHPFLQDVAFAFDYKLPRSLPPMIEMNGRVVNLTDLSSGDYSKPETVARRSMTQVQRQLTLEGVRSMNYLLTQRGIAVFHAVVPSAPPWFVEEMSQVLEEAREDLDGTVEVLGQFPDTDKYGRDYINDHSGRHYTPDFNSYWAGEMMTVLESHGIVGAQTDP
jgi:hypothetical protein